MRILFLLLLALAGCSGDDIKDYYRLGELRILSMQADTPEVAPGGSANVTPLVSDLNGGGRALTYSAEACVDPGIDLGNPPTCAIRPDRVVLATNAPLPLPGPEYTANGPAIAVTVPATILAGRPPQDLNNGVAYLLFYTVTAADGATTTAFKRILVSTRAPKNTNPTITALRGDGVAFTTLPANPVDLSIQIAPGSAETYVLMASDGTTSSVTEDLLSTFFISDGSLDNERSRGEEAVRWAPTGQPAGRRIVVVGVVRDRRGGETSLVKFLP